MNDQQYFKFIELPGIVEIIHNEMNVIGNKLKKQR